MTITTEQKKAIAESGIEPVAIEESVRGSTYYIIRSDVYEKMRGLVKIEHSDPSLYEYEDFRPIHESP